MQITFFKQKRKKIDSDVKITLAVSVLAENDSIPLILLNILASWKLELETPC